MNKFLESIRGSWVARDREAAEANRTILQNAIDRIPADLREKFLSVIAWAEHTQEWSDIIIDGTAKEGVRHTEEVMFLEEQIKMLIQQIRVTKDLDSIRGLRTVARETIERMRERSRQEELKRLHMENRRFTPPGIPPSSLVVP
jgi:hypothetical protein